MRNETEALAEQMADSGLFDGIADEQYWSGGFDSEAYMARLIKHAEWNGVSVDPEWDYETFFRDLYDNTEKGLS